ncbi:hypothetical protein RDWZM_000324 [Blomia tropicalis]|uniref:Transmembrane protein n=1 Tax=Blomia tropicalis TaxID=40697 RepID=A0A9Q0MAD8_BLOTA|nr:hypothetical protein RDWZM_000324 [Blomia tropicalis]
MIRYIIVGIVILSSSLHESILVNSERLCDEQGFNVFAADNLSNGTIRLFSDMYYWNFEIDYSANLSNETPFRLIGHISPASKSIGYKLSEKYSNLTHKIIDDSYMRISVTSFLDPIENIKFMMVFHNKMCEGKYKTNFTYWFEETGKLYFQSNQDFINDRNQSYMIHSVIVFSIDNIQYSAIICNNQFFLSNIKTNNSTKQVFFEFKVNKEVEKMFRGPIPKLITAAFVVQPKPDKLIGLVFIQCNKYCFVGWNQTGKYFNLTQCNFNLQPPLDDDLFKLSFIKNDQLLNDLEPIHSNVSSETKSLATNRGLISTTKVAHQNSSEFNFNFFFVICTILIFSTGSICTVYFCVLRQNQSYNLSKMEARFGCRTKADTDDHENDNENQMIEMAELNLKSTNLPIIEEQDEH